MKLILAKVLARKLYQLLVYGTIIKCEVIIKAILENPKADQNTLFRKCVVFEPPRVYF